MNAITNKKYKLSTPHGVLECARDEYELELEDEKKRLHNRYEYVILIARFWKYMFFGSVGFFLGVITALSFAYIYSDVVTQILPI